VQAHGGVWRNEHEDGGPERGATGLTPTRAGDNEQQGVGALHVKLLALHVPRMVLAGARSAAYWRLLGPPHPVKRHGVPSVEAVAINYQKATSIQTPCVVDIAIRSSPILAYLISQKRLGNHPQQH